MPPKRVVTAAPRLAYLYPCAADGRTEEHYRGRTKERESEL